MRTPFISRKRHEAALRVAAFFAERPGQPHHGYYVARCLQLSGAATLLALSELEAAGVLISWKEELEEARMNWRTGRPRRYYRLKTS